MTKSHSFFHKHFGSLPDHRVIGRTAHKLFDIIFIAVSACIANCDDWNMVVLWARQRESWLRRFCELPNGIPSHDTFSRFFARLDPVAFHDAFIGWMQEIQEITNGDIVAIDGKTIRRSFDRNPDGHGAIHMVSAWLTKNRLVLGQLKVEEKSNEITAIPELLKLLEIKGALVTIDAMGCQKEIASEIVKHGADYLLAVKDNQPTLAEDVKRTFEESVKEQLIYTRTFDDGHGRIEIREYFQSLDLTCLRTADEWLGLKSLGKVVSHRNENGEWSVETRYYISSLGRDVERMANGIRSHWGIENQLHYILDMSFDEDHRRVRKGDGAENMSVVRHIAMNYLSQAKNLKIGIKNRRNLAAISTDILQQIICAVPFRFWKRVIDP
jgi:predicted transposase YbfD/YdcC